MAEEIQASEMDEEEKTKKVRMPSSSAISSFAFTSITRLKNSTIPIPHHLITSPNRNRDGGRHDSLHCAQTQRHRRHATGPVFPGGAPGERDAIGPRSLCPERPSVESPKGYHPYRGIEQPPSGQPEPGIVPEFPDPLVAPCTGPEIAYQRWFPRKPPSSTPPDMVPPRSPPERRPPIID